VFICLKVYLYFNVLKYFNFFKNKVP